MLVLRGHHLLCLPRFQGAGYSEGFTANLAGIAKSLQKDPHQLVRVVAGPDDICNYCPHLKGDRCELDMEGNRTAERDMRVLALAGLAAGQSGHYSHLQSALRTALQTSSLQQACEGCRWLELCLRFPEA